MKKQKQNNKIAFIGRYNAGDIISGPEKTAKRIFEKSSAKYDPVFIQYYFDGNQYGLKKKLFGYDEYFTESGQKIYTLGVIRLFFFLIKLKPFIIHIITFERFAHAAVYYARLWKVKLVYNSHGIIIHEDAEIKKENKSYRSRNKRAEQLFLERANKIVFPSENAILISERYYKLDESRIEIIPNGIDEKFHKISTLSVRKGVVFLSGGALHSSRRTFIKTILDFFNLNIQLFIIGDKDYFSGINIPGVYLFSAMKNEELAEFYRDKDVFLSLNDYDTFSISTAEAMASGLIPIVTKQTGISTLIFNDVNGYVIDYNDTEQLKCRLDRLIGMNNVEKETMRNNAKSIYYKLNWDSVFAAYDTIYSTPAK